MQAFIACAILCDSSCWETISSWWDGFVFTLLWTPPRNEVRNSSLKIRKRWDVAVVGGQVCKLFIRIKHGLKLCHSKIQSGWNVRCSDCNLFLFVILILEFLSRSVMSLFYTMLPYQLCSLSSLVVFSLLGSSYIHYLGNWNVCS